METLDQYLTRLASSAPTPGGGSAATIVAAMGAALLAMVSRICADAPRLASARPQALELTARAERLRGELEGAGARDEAAFMAVVHAQALPRSSSAEKAVRSASLEVALHHAAAEPLHGATRALDVLRLCERVLAIPNTNLASDVGCAAEFAAAAVAACAYNVRINHRFMKDARAIAEQATALERCEREARALLQGVRTSVMATLER